jgi:cytochrome P450
MEFLERHGLVELSNVAYIEHWTTQLAEKRRAELQSRKANNVLVKNDSSAPKDFMTKFIESHLDDPESFTWKNLVDMSIINITGGSDTIASTVSMMLYHFVKNPRVVSKLRAEIKSSEESGTISNPVLFNETQKLEYLHAVIKESMRLGSAFGFNFARTVPETGSHLCGFFFPAGSVVGINPYVAHHNPTVFGEDFMIFRPERWLKSETDEKTRAKMERYFLSWGLGARTCLGRNVALMEIQKLVPQLLRRFDFQFGPGMENTELVTRNSQVMLVMNLSLQVKLRPDANKST